MNNNITAERLQQLRAEMQTGDVDLVVLGTGAHMQWLLGFHPHPDERPCLLLVSRTHEAFLMPALNAEGTRKQCDIRLFNWRDDEGPDKALREALSAIEASDARSIVLDETMRADFALLLLEQFPTASHQFTGDTLGKLRMRKNSNEYACLKENALINDRAMKAGFDAIKPGMSELELQDVIKNHFSSEQASILFGIVGTGENGAFPHHQTGESVIQNGDAIVIDIGAQKNGFPSDMTRMAIVGDGPEGYMEIHRIVEAAVIAALAAAKPGVRACDVDAAARETIEQAGYGEYFVHRTGHGLGMEIHEPPYITSTSQTVLESGMVFSIEPGIYLPGRFGIRLEEIVILREDGPEILSELPRDVRVI